MNKSDSTMFLRMALGAAALGLATVAWCDDGTRFQETGRVADRAADWVALDEGRIAFGSERRIHLGRVLPAVTPERTIVTDESYVEGVLVGDRLYLSDGADLFILEFDEPAARPRRHVLEPAVAAPIRIARMDDLLVVAEDGVGLRILTLLPPPEHRAGMQRLHPHHTMEELVQVGRLPLDKRFVALAAATRQIYAAVEDGTVARIDARDPARPAARTGLTLGRPPQALAASGDSLFVLDEAGLTLLEQDGSGGTTPMLQVPQLGGRALALAGRAIHLARGEAGLATLVDRSPQAANQTVTLSGFSFQPASVVVNAGDTVTWSNVSGFHNVESCDGTSGSPPGNDPDPPGCLGQIAAEGFFHSGNPAFQPWTYPKTFNTAGSNRYFCEVHVGLNMFGTVQVLAPAAPPGVPDGTTGAPLQVAKLLADGSRLRLTFDTSTCVGNADHHVALGFGSQLPAAPGGSYALTGSGACNIGGSPFTWLAVPDPAADPSRLLWFVVLADDNGTREGSWGTASDGSERNGPGPGGSSGQCGILTKDLTNGCGQ